MGKSDGHLRGRAVAGLVLSGLVLLVSSPSTAQTVDPSFAPFLETAGWIKTMITLGDGKVVAGGSMRDVGGVPRYALVRLNSDGTVDDAFVPALSRDAYVTALALDLDGKLVVGGSLFLEAGGGMTGLVRLHADGSADPSFVLTKNFDINAIVVQADGKLIIGGEEMWDLGVWSRVARLHPDGRVDLSFQPPDFNRTVRALQLQADGKVIVGGDFYYGVVGIPHLRRLNADGSVDPSFTASGAPNAYVYDIVTQPDGKLIVAGWFTQICGASRKYLARLNSDGTLDPSFDPGDGPEGLFRKLVLLPDGKILAIGRYTTDGISALDRIERFNPDGSADSSFSFILTNHESIETAVLQADGSIVVGGGFTSLGGHQRFALGRLSPAGVLDPSYTPRVRIDPTVRRVVRQADGKIFITGNFDTVGGVLSRNLARLSPAGALDPEFFENFPGVDSSIGPLLVADAGTILIAGGFTRVGSTPRRGIARLHANGSLDSSFDPGTGFPISGGSPYELLELPDGRIMAAGGFTLYNGVTRRRLCRIEADGSLDTTFDPGSGPNSSVSAMLRQADGKLVIGGNFTSYGGTSVSRIARVDAAGALDPSFGTLGSGANRHVTTLAPTNDGKILVGGRFDAVYGQTRQKVARLSAEGAVDPGFDPPAETVTLVYTLLPSADTATLVGGYFSVFGGVRRGALVRLTESGTLDPSFHLGSGIMGYVTSLAAEPEGAVLVGGWFKSVNGVNRTALARILPAGIGGYDLGVERNGAGEGAVASSPEGIDCGTVCAAGFAAGQLVTLTASPVLNSVFAGWAGACSGLGVCEVTMDGAKGVTATFEPLPPLVAVRPHVDLAGGSSADGNGVLEPGEQVILSPIWHNPGPAGKTVTGTISGLTGPPGATYTIVDGTASYGVVPAGGDAHPHAATGNAYAISVSSPTSRPAAHWDVQVTETLSTGETRTWIVHVGDSFADVPRSHWAYRFIETIFHNRVTSGCNAAPFEYCPGSTLTRAQMAVLLLMARHGPAWVPPAPTGTVFVDVPPGHWAGAFIEALVAAGITSGCDVGMYCPDEPISRAQMAVFLLMAKHGPGYVPPPSTGLVFTDVPIDHWAGDFIEQLAAEGITGGCGPGVYCPDGIVTRAEMAVFLTATFGLLLGG